MKSSYTSHFLGNNYNNIYPANPEIASFGSNQLLVNDILTVIFSHADLVTLGRCCKLNKFSAERITIILNEKRTKLYGRVFSPLDWDLNFKNNGITDQEKAEAFKSFPPNIDEIPCPVFKNKKMIDTHVITYFPRNLTINSYGNFLKQKMNNSRGYDSISQEIVKEFGDTPIDKAGWKAMTKEACTFSKKGCSLRRYIERRPDNVRYMSPQGPGLLHAIVCISSEFFKSGTLIFNNYSLLCQENVYDRQFLVKSSASGLDVFVLNRWNEDDIGIASTRHFKSVVNSPVLKKSNLHKV